MAENSFISVRSLVTNGTDNTSPSSNTFKVGTAVSGFSRFSAITILATITGGTGGALDVIVENSPDGTNWYEFCHFTQVAAAQTKTYTFAPALSGAMVNIGKNTADGTGLGTTMVLTAGNGVGGPWFDLMRVRYVAGASTTAGATQAVSVIGLSGSGLA